MFDTLIIIWFACVVVGSAFLLYTEWQARDD